MLPPQSAKLLPKPYAELMLQDESPIADFYPKEFSTDANGKRQPWEAVVKVRRMQHRRSIVCFAHHHFINRRSPSFRATDYLTL